MSETKLHMYQTQEFLLKMFRLRTVTVFSSPQKLYCVLVPQNRHQCVTSTVTRLLVSVAWCLAILQTKRHKLS